MSPRILPWAAATTRFESLPRRSLTRCQRTIRPETDSGVSIDPKLAMCSWRTRPSRHLVSTILTLADWASDETERTCVVASFVEDIAQRIYDATTRSSRPLAAAVLLVAGDPAVCVHPPLES